MIHIKKINHVNLIIPRGKEEEARAFYGKALGLRELKKPADLAKNGGLWFEIETTGTQIHLSFQEGYDPNTTKAHVAYEVTDLEALKREFQKLSISVKESSPTPGYLRCEIRDPFGNRIEFMQSGVG